ncbi:hypothetical protein [Arcicella lustrica]|uniref:Uncharacterized protein n=1 Tax=Arcicella lustrica TaxID=2984196 RepID=A0ABU5SHW8_9BACT|nr:hypothetical protein [Arcicella sp. DC25W]MEA5426812.1 hypothetical protein [Arcicella sp. DC25W]
MEFQTNDKLRAYIQKIDDLAETLKIDILKNLPWLSPTLQSQAFAENQEIIRLGCRVWVRWINDVDRTFEPNIQFVQRKEDNIEGRRGIKFWQIMSSKANAYESSLSSSSNLQSINLMPYFAKMAPYGEIVFAVAGLLSDSSGKVQYVQNLILDDFSKLVNCFFEFIDEYKKEFALQFPDLITKPKENNNVGSVDGSGLSNLQTSTPVSSANVPQSITDFVSKNQNYIAGGIAIFLGYQILKSRNNA